MVFNQDYFTKFPYYISKITLENNIILFQGLIQNTISNSTRSYFTAYFSRISTIPKTL